MKQEIITYLSTIKEELVSLATFLYDNPEESFHEKKACKYITKLLQKNNFEITENYLNIPNSFLAKFGNGHPKICYICEYDADPKNGHITANNLVSTISVGAGLALSKVIPKIGGSITLIGCPGELLNGSKSIMVKQGAFDDIDVVFMIQPHVENIESGSSSAVLPIKITYENKNSSSNKIATYSLLDACLFTFNSINLLLKGFCEDCTIDGVTINTEPTLQETPTKIDSKFYIKTKYIADAYQIQNKFKELVNSVSYLMDIDSKVTLEEFPCEELISNATLSRLFSHNLKENGIIDIKNAQKLSYGLSLGCISHKVPCICPLVSIVEDNSIPFLTKDFAKATISCHALETVMKCAEALAVTGIDLIEKENLLAESKKELAENHKL